MTDMKVARIKNYMVKRFSLYDALGEGNDQLTRARVKGLLEYEKQLAIQANYILDMDYNIVTMDTDKVKCNVKLYISDVLRVVELDVELKISAYEGE